MFFTRQSASISLSMGIFPCIKTGLATVHDQSHSPVTISFLASLDTLFLTLHLYFPGSLPVTVSVLVLAVIVMLVTVGEVPSDNSLSSRLQVTVAVGSPVKTQVRVNTGGSAVGMVWRLNWGRPVTLSAEGGVEIQFVVKYSWVNWSCATATLKHYFT